LNSHLGMNKAHLILPSLIDSHLPMKAALGMAADKWARLLMRG